MLSKYSYAHIKIKANYMGIIGGRFGYWLLRKITGRIQPVSNDDEPIIIDFKLREFFGGDIYNIIHGKTVLDFGCGVGVQAVEMAMNGAGKVIGLDIRENVLVEAEKLSHRYSVLDRCVFLTNTTELVDIIICKDAFEHFTDPAFILGYMATLLKPEGVVLAVFGPTWLHPYGGHLFSVFPWAHLIFTERALIRWRADFKSDGAMRFSEVEGGLNQLTIRSFEKFVEDSPLYIESLETVPIKGIGLFKSRIFREYGTSIVRSKLRLKLEPT